MTLARIYPTVEPFTYEEFTNPVHVKLERMIETARGSVIKEQLEYVWQEPDVFGLIKVYYRQIWDTVGNISVRGDTFFIKDTRGVPVDPARLCSYIEVRIRQAIADKKDGSHYSD